MQLKQAVIVSTIIAGLAFVAGGACSAYNRMELAEERIQRTEKSVLELAVSLEAGRREATADQTRVLLAVDALREGTSQAANACTVAQMAVTGAVCPEPGSKR